MSGISKKQGIRKNQNFLKFGFFVFVLLFAFISNKAFSQAASATWPLTANANATIAGNITTAAALVTNSITNAGYSANGVQANQWATNTNPVTQTTENLQFTITPACAMTVQSISFDHMRDGTNGYFRVRYSVNGGAYVNLSDITVNTTIGNYASPAQTIAVPAGQTFRVRLCGATNAINTTNLYVRNFVISGTTASINPSVSIAAVPTGLICPSTSVTFTATPTNGGGAPTYQWKVNGGNVGANSATYTSSTWVNNDQVICVMTSNAACVSPAAATSNTITMSVGSTPATPGPVIGLASVDPATAGLGYSVSAVAGATTYTWTVPAGWIITAGQSTITLTVTSGAVGQDGNISVTASNACGTSAASIFGVVIIPPIPPHNLCSGCHINHTAPAAQLTMVGGNANLCMSCHNATGSASSMPFSNAMKAIPGVSGNSHNWNMLSVNAPFQTNLTTNSEMLIRVINDTIICSTCHNQHSSNTIPNFLRISNDEDAMCMNCHTARNKARYVDNPTNKSTHPVGILYPSGTDPRFNISMSFPLSLTSKVVCSSCHDMHNATSSDGNLLRTATIDAICSSCHIYSSSDITLNHKNMTCTTCHYGHQTGSNNIYLINDNIVTPNSGTKPVVFTANTAAANYADAAGTYNGVCEVCHTTTDHYTNTTGGTADARHVPATQKCVNCHPHNKAFSAQTDCFACHNAITDKPSIPGTRRQIVDAAGNGTGAGGDFKRTSHHVTGSIPNVSDCVKCHYMGDHKQGTVKLIDPDLGYQNIISYNPANKASIESFCLKCHDVNGANGDLTPFSDNVSVPVIDQTLWNASAHKGNVNANTCLICHDNGHGSNKRNLLAPYTKVTDGNADSMDDEEDMCYKTCHTAAGSATTNIETEFTRMHKHQVDEVAQNGTNSNLECVSCHNPHQNTNAYPVSNPDNTSILWTQTTNGVRDFCIKCHDGAPPTGIVFPATYYGTGWNKSNYVNSRHDAVINTGESNFTGAKEDCLACHDHHGTVSTDASTSKTGQYTMIKWRYDKSGAAGSNTCNPWSAADYNLCFRCHQNTILTTQGLFNQHDKHINGQQTPCIICHDVHNPYDAGERGLINFTYGNSTRSGTDITGVNLSTGFAPGSNCVLTCHTAASGFNGCGSMGHNDNYGGTAIPYPWSYAWPF